MKDKQQHFKTREVHAVEVAAKREVHAHGGDRAQPRLQVRDTLLNDERIAVQVGARTRRLFTPGRGPWC